MSSGEAKRMPLPGRAEALVEVIDNMASDPHRTQASALGPHSFIKKGNESHMQHRVSNVHFSSKNEEWATPEDFFDVINSEFGLLWDACATHENYKLPLYWTKNEDGLSTDWRGKRIWMNPPYGSVIGHWVKKAATGRAEVVVCLLPARTDTRWFHDHIYQNPHAEIRFIKGRIRFAGAAHSAPFPSMLVIFRNPSS